MSTWSKKETDEIDRRLNLGLGPEYIAHRAGGRGSVPYVEGWKVIHLANQVFGFDGWSSEIKELKVDYADEIEGRINMGVSATIRVTLKNGVCREDCGYGSIDNCRNKSLAYDKCRKEACTDGLKRCLRLFGSALGNCLYDLRFISKVTKIKPKFKPFNEDDLLRPDLELSSVRKMTAEKVDERPKVPATRNTSSTKEVLVNNNEIPLVDGIPFLNSQDFQSDESDFEAIDGLPHVEDILESQGLVVDEDIEKDDVQNKQPENEKTSPKPLISGFVSARAAESLQEKRPITTLDAFNPNFQSPQLKRTLDHNMSVPVKRSTQETPTPNRFGKSSGTFQRTPLQEKNTGNIPITEKRAKSAI